MSAPSRSSTPLWMHARDRVASWFARTTRTSDGTGEIVERTFRGRLVARTRHEDGRAHGPATAWWPTGAKKYHGQHVRGLRDGDWFEFQPDGALDRVRTGLYRDGVRIAGIRGFNEWLGSP